jgi:hypothetical protein
VPWAVARLPCPLVCPVCVSFPSIGYVMNIQAVWKHEMYEIGGQMFLDCLLLIEPDCHMLDTNIFEQIEFIT